MSLCGEGTPARSPWSLKEKQSPLFGPQDKQAVGCDLERQEGKAATISSPESWPHASPVFQGPCQLQGLTVPSKAHLQRLGAFFPG